jgi:hypothetical protein
MEAFATKDLRFWHAQVGFPGSLNDLNILERSNLIDAVLSGRIKNSTFFINGNEYNTQPYFLADGIYPKWKIFQQPISEPVGRKHKLYTKLQEACRKDIERAFGALKIRFHILSIPNTDHKKNRLSTTPARTLSKVLYL